MKEQQFYAAMYLRLSRDDSDIADSENRDGRQINGSLMKSESNSIGNQRELIKTYIREQSNIELYDIYVDDGFSGSNFNRPDFQRMISDIEAGSVNCVIVKDLSRFGRDYIEAGRYIQKTFPSLGVRFIALTDHYDSFSADTGESSIVLPVKNFINDSYCRDTSIKVKSQFEVKRKNGEYIAPFALYGYQKDEKDHNHLVIDTYAAENVKKIFLWKIRGLANAAIADRLNSLGILSPKEYKKSTGTNYKGGFSGGGTVSLWGSTAVKRILRNETYLGHMVQGKTQKINYKVKKVMDKPESDWVRVEKTHEAIISEEDFEVVQNLLKADGRKSPAMTAENPFSGILYCGDCGEQMVRRVVRYRGTERIYYVCSTNNRAQGCSRHSILESELTRMAEEFLKTFCNAFLNQRNLFDEIRHCEVNFEQILPYDKEIERLQKERNKYYELCSCLYEDLRKEVISKEEFERLQAEFQTKSEWLEETLKKQENLIKDMFQKGVASAGRLKTLEACGKVEHIDLMSMRRMIKRITIYEEKQLEIEFYFQNEYEIMLHLCEAGKRNEKERGVS